MFAHPESILLQAHLSPRRPRAVVEPAGRRGISSSATPCGSLLPTRSASRPRCFTSGRKALVRSWIDGVALPSPSRTAMKPISAGAHRLAGPAPRRPLPQRPRQGTELAARPRRKRLSDRFPAGGPLPSPPSAATPAGATSNAPRIARRPPQQPLPPPLRQRTRAERTAAVALQPLEHRRGQRGRQERRHQRGRDIA